MSYWKKRQNQLNKALETDEAALMKRLEAYYKTEEEKLNRQIASYYAKYGKDNVIEYRKLLQQLPDADIQILMRDMDEFARKYPEYANLLPVRESAYRLNRLEGLQYSVQIEQLNIGAIEQQELEKHLTALAERSYDAVIETTGAVADEWSDIVKTVVNTDWTRKGNFSSTIWKNRQNLTQTLNSDIASGFARGDNYQSMVSMIRHKFKVSHDEAYRLIYTEGTFVMNESKAKAIEQTFEYYSVITAGDDKVCSQCREAQDNTQAHPVKIADRVAGVNFPPFHPWCRCTTQIVVPDPQKWIDEYVTKHGGDPDITEEQRRKAEDILKKYDNGAESSKKDTPQKEHSEAYEKLIDGLTKEKVKKLEVGTLPSTLTSTEIIDKLAGGDMTKGSCSSLAFAYIGNRSGYDVTDYRGGRSREFFSYKEDIKKMLRLPNVKGNVIMVQHETFDTVEIIKNLNFGKEYYLSVGRHSSIVKNTENGAEYLELQSKYGNGWKPFDTYGSTAETLQERFGCRKTVDKWQKMTIEKPVILMEVDSFKGNDEFKDILGYINTAVDKQKKGVTGSVK